jgi:SAM-dependent methyltransferase
MSRVVSKPPYTLLARFYDEMVGDAAERNRHARGKLLADVLPRVRSACDLGCGTGSTAIELARQGPKVFAIDLAPHMCRRAREKARRAQVPVRVRCADMRHFRLPEPVDLVLSEFNPLNHLPRKSDLGPTFRAVARALRPGGHFCFDLNTHRSLQEQYPSTHWIETRDYCVIIHGGFGPRRDKAWLEFEWFLPEGKGWRRYRERVVETCWSDAEIRRALRAAAFRKIRSWDGTQVRPPSPEQRVGYDTYYLAQKRN